MKNLKTFLLTLLTLFTFNSVYSEQTFHGDYRNSATFYYKVPAKTHILRGVKPSSFYLAFSDNDGLSWNKASNTFVWGNEGQLTGWVPSSVTSLGRLGIFTDTNGTWSNTVSPYDITDTLEVKYGEVSSFTFSKSNLNYNEPLTLTWKTVPVTLPSVILLQTKSSNSSTWVNLQYVSSSTNSYSTTLKIKDVQDFRLTYIDSSYTLTQGSVSYTKPTAGFLFKSDWQNKTVKSDATIILNGIYNSKMPLKFSVYDGRQTRVLTSDVDFKDSTFEFQYSQVDKMFTNSSTFLILSNENDILDWVVVNFKHKYLSVQNLSNFIENIEPIELNWSYSDDNWIENKVLISQQIKNSPSGTVTTVKTIPWTLSDRTTILYSSLPSGSYSRFVLYTKDIFNDEVLAETNWFKVGSPCDSLQESYVKLNRENVKLTKTVDSLMSTIRELKLTKDSILIVFERTVSGVERISDFNIKTMPTITPTGDFLVLTSKTPISEVQVYDVTGKKLTFNITNSTDYEKLIPKSSFSSGLYFILIIDSQSTSVYKFIK